MFMSPSALVKREQEEDDEEEEEEDQVEEFEEEEEVEDEELQEEQERVIIKEHHPTTADDIGGSSPMISPILRSVNHLQSLHVALSDFVRRYNDLQTTLDFIQSSIINQTSDLESICKAMASKALRTYISNHLSEIGRLRREVPEALKLAPDPAKLVLDAMRQFYLHGSSGYGKPHSAAILVRRASILLLEFYVLAGCPSHSNAGFNPFHVKKSAEDAAVAWKKRIDREGGIKSVGAVDALGLVLFFASFGIPPQFTSDDLCHLFRLSNPRKKADVFRHSPILADKMPDIIRDMITENMHVEAVDLICAFGLEEKFPPLDLLASFLQEAYDVGYKEKSGGQFSFRLMKEADEKKLAAVKLVVRCLEDHKLDASKLAGFKISKKIAKLETQISKMERKLQEQKLRGQESKRKFNNAEPSKSPEVQAKRPWPVSGEASCGSSERSGMGLPAGDVHGTEGGWQGNETFYQNLGAQSLLRMPHSSGNYYTGPSAIAGHSFYQPHTLAYGVGGMSSGNYHHQFGSPVLRQDSYYSKPIMSDTVPAATNTGNHPSFLG